MHKRKFIIDCDAGVDDAFALILALSEDDVDVLAITCVGGNTALDQVAVNVMKVLEACKRTDVPVYKGAGKSLINFHGEVKASHVHGMDGLGDAEGIPDPDMTRLRQEHAVDTILKLTNENPGEVTLVTLAPLTNIALACRMDPNFTKNIKNVVIMGGNFEAKGNDNRVCSEFNFHSDVESAFVCLNEFKCPVSIVTWEACLRHGLSWSIYDEMAGMPSEKSKFFGKISEGMAKFYKRYKEGFGKSFTSCDAIAMAVAINPEAVIQKTHLYATVELSGHHTRGQMVVDWGKHLKKEANVMLVQDIDMDIYTMLAINALK